MFNFGQPEVVTDKNKISETLIRGVEEIVVAEELEAKLKSGKRLRVKLGIDPTSPNIHLGRAIPLLKLKDFQSLGHEIVLIIGDFTGLIGDTSDKESERPMLSQHTIKENLKSYTEQANKIIDIKKCEVHYNSEWLSKLDYYEVGKQADIFSLSDFITRENIKRRLDEGKRVSLRELLYPLMQGYDSVAVKADVEIGGTDQRFNLLAGRDLQRLYNQEPQSIMTLSLIEGLDGRKMSSSWSNTIDFLDPADEMYGKVMSLKDELIIKYFIMATRVEMAEVSKYEGEIKNGGNPMNHKRRLAYEVVKLYHSQKDAEEAQNNFTDIFSRGEFPEDARVIEAKKEEKLANALTENKIVESKSEFRRLVEAGAVSDYPDKKMNDPHETVGEGERRIKIGKKTFVTIRPK